MRLTRRGENVLMYAGIVLFFIVYGIAGSIEFGG